MSRPAGATRRSGDPRKRAAAEEPSPGTGLRTRQVVVVAAVVGAVLLALGWLALRPADEEVDEAGRGHAEVACDYTAKAGEAAEMDTSARYAAAVLLLDKAMVESRRAADADAGFADLDEAVRAVHAAGHRRDADRWGSALDSALSTCESVG